MEFLPQCFAALVPYRQFIVYRLVPSKNRFGKNDKLPINFRTAQIANAHDTEIQTDCNSAIEYARALGKDYGVGFVFTDKDPFWFLDIDECLTPDNTWSELAVSLLTVFKGAAVEVSSSGRGLHIIGSGSAPHHGCKNSDYKIEFYTQGRFVALTGLQAQGDAGLNFDSMLEWLVNSYFTGLPAENYDHAWTSEPCEGWRGSDDDDIIIDRALRSSSARATFGNGANFRDLWTADIDVLQRAYPAPDRAEGYDVSSADAALAQHLAFWTGNNCERMQTIMLRSELRRDKWEREDYLPRTIRNACARQKEWLNDVPPEPPVTASITGDRVAIRPSRVTGTTFLGVEDQEKLFEGCIYVQDEHKVLIPGGYLLNPERFRVAYGGYNMMMDNQNVKTTRNAWEAFTESQVLRAPRAQTTCFKPELPPCEIVHQDSETLANIWWPIQTPCVAGDVTPFLNHLRLLFPDERDRMIVLAYMAACVQHKGFKFQYCLFIQGVEGNGKTFLSHCIARAIGNRYTHYPKANEITNKFNDWLYAKLFIAIEDIYTPEMRLEIPEILKPMVTSNRLEIEPKGGNKVTRDVCANFIINSNHKDGLRKTRNDRRFAHFYTPQEYARDLIRDGMTEEYFRKLYAWANAGGFAAITHFLYTMTIPDEFNPAGGCQRAPRTTSTESAIDHGRGAVEQEINEAIETGVPGFRKGWVSSIALEGLLNKLGASRRIPINKRRDLMRSLEYDYHPGLKDGRTNNTVMPDGGKPRLYVCPRHPSLALTTAAEIAKAYENDQIV